MMRLGAGVARGALGLSALVLSACGGGGSASAPAPPPATYTLSGTLSNLAPGSNGVTLALNGVVQGTYGTNGGVQFPPLPAGTYTLSVATQPSKPQQTCTVSPASVAIVNADITNISVTCTPTYYTIGGVIHGIANTTLTIATQVNGAALTYTPLTDQSFGYPAFSYPMAVLPGTTYNTSIAVQPAGPGFSATCAFAPGTESGTVANANVTSIVVNCTAAPAPPPPGELAISADGQSLSLFRLSPTLASVGSAPTPLQILPTPNITGVAADPTGTIYYTANAGTAGSNAALYICPPPSLAGQPYSCGPFPGGYAAAIPGGKLLSGGVVLNLDGFANGLALLEASITSSGTTIFSLSPNPAAASVTNPTAALPPLTAVYTASGTPVDVSAQFGAGVAIPGVTPPAFSTALYVWETYAGSSFGSSVRAYACIAPCKPGMQIEITQPVLAALGAPAALSGQLLVGRPVPDFMSQAELIIGLANPYGSTPAPAALSTVASLSGQVTLLSGGQLSFTATATPGHTDQVSFPLLAGGLNPFVGTSALALDPTGNLYAAHGLTNQGQSVAAGFLDGSAFSGYAGVLGNFQFAGFACSTTPATCPVNLLPTLAVGTTGAPVPQVMAVVPTCQPFSAATTTYCGTLSVEVPVGAGAETLIGTFAFAADPAVGAAATQTISNCYLVILGSDPDVTTGCSGSYTSATGAFQINATSGDATITFSGTATQATASATVTIANFGNLGAAPGSGSFTGTALSL